MLMQIKGEKEPFKRRKLRIEVNKESKCFIQLKYIQTNNLKRH